MVIKITKKRMMFFRNSHITKYLILLQIIVENNTDVLREEVRELVEYLKGEQLKDESEVTVF